MEMTGIETGKVLSEIGTKMTFVMAVTVKMITTMMITIAVKEIMVAKAVIMETLAITQTATAAMKEATTMVIAGAGIQVI